MLSFCSPTHDEGGEGDGYREVEVRKAARQMEAGTVEAERKAAAEEVTSCVGERGRERLEARWGFNCEEVVTGVGVLLLYLLVW